MLKLKSYLIVVLCCLSFSGITLAQCPANIGFDFGDFTNWEGETGIISKVDGTLSFSGVGIVQGRHTIIYSKDKLTDPYGGFPLVSPNGSSCFVQLGNSQSGGQAEKLSYTFTIPANNPEYSLIYYYAVVLQNPNHFTWQQPRFTAKIFNVSDNQYAACGTFDFSAGGNLPGFLTGGGGVLYKPWSAVTINLAGLSGKTLRLEFTTNDCSPGGHFGYAYLDVNQNCSSPVSGNTYCVNNPPSATLEAPSGFAQYFWYNGNDFTNVIGTQNTISFVPAPPIGTKYAVRIVPYPGIGCEDTIYTTIRASEKLTLKVKDSISTCDQAGIDLTDTTITSGSNADFTYTYFSDSTCVTNIIGPKTITATGIYYIKATTPGGCYVVKPIHLYVFSQASLSANSPPAVCAPSVANITLPGVTVGSDPGLTFSYWKDAAATKPVVKPTAIDSSGTYYIKAQNHGGCFIIKPLSVIINPLPKLVVNNPNGCYYVDLTAPQVTLGSSGVVKLTYWLDSLATQPLALPQAVASSGRYFIKAESNGGCITIAPVVAGVYLPPVLDIINPAPVIYPAPVNITDTFTPQAGIDYTYWLDTACTKPLKTPNTVQKNGTYYIKATNHNACFVIKPVRVSVGKPPDIVYSTNVFTPNGDNVNDTFKLNIPSYVQFKYFKIYNNLGTLVFETSSPTAAWDGKFSGKPVPVGTYYWVFEGYDNYYTTQLNKAGSISLVR